MKMTFKQLAKYGSTALALGASTASFAAMDVTASITEIASNTAPIYAVGVAVFAIVVAIAATKWIRRVL